MKRLLTLMALELAVAAALIALGPYRWLALVGALVWPAAEYGVHRVIFHHVLKKIHGAHHRRPTEVRYFAVPIRITAPVVALVALAHGGALAGGLLIAKAVYDLVHLACHGMGPLKGRLPWTIVKHHLEHHRDPRVAFAVTIPAIDRLLGTAAA